MSSTSRLTLLIKSLFGLTDARTLGNELLAIGLVTQFNRQRLLQMYDTVLNVLLENLDRFDYIDLLRRLLTNQSVLNLHCWTIIRRRQDQPELLQFFLKELDLPYLRKAPNFPQLYMAVLRHLIDKAPSSVQNIVKRDILETLDYADPFLLPEIYRAAISAGHTTDSLFPSLAQSANFEDSLLGAQYSDILDDLLSDDFPVSSHTALLATKIHLSDLAPNSLLIKLAEHTPPDTAEGLYIRTLLSTEAPKPPSSVTSLNRPEVHFLKAYHLHLLVRRCLQENAFQLELTLESTAPHCPSTFSVVNAVISSMWEARSSLVRWLLGVIYDWMSSYPIAARPGLTTLKYTNALCQLAQRHVPGALRCLAASAQHKIIAQPIYRLVKEFDSIVALTRLYLQDCVPYKVYEQASLAMISTNSKMSFRCFSEIGAQEPQRVQSTVDNLLSKSYELNRWMSELIRSLASEGAWEDERAFLGVLKVFEGHERECAHGLISLCREYLTRYVVQNLIELFRYSTKSLEDQLNSQLRCVEPFITKLGLMEKEYAVRALLPIIKIQHSIALNAMVARSAGASLDSDAIPRLFTDTELNELCNPSDFQDKIQDGSIILEKIGLADCRELVEVHRSAVGERDRQGNHRKMVHPMTRVLEDLLSAKNTLHALGWTAALSECTLYNPGPISSAEGGIDKFKAILTRTLQSNLPVVPTQLQAPTVLEELAALYEITFLNWLLLLNHVFTPMFKSFLAALSMAETTSQAKRIFQFLKNRTWKEAGIPAKMINPQTDLNGAILLLLLLASLGRAYSAVAADATELLLNLHTHTQTHDQVSMWIKGASLVCLAHVSNLNRLETIALTQLADASNLPADLQRRMRAFAEATACDSIGHYTTDTISHLAAFYTLCHQYESKLNIYGPKALQLRDLLIEVVHSTKRDFFSLLMAWSDMQCLESVTISSPKFTFTPIHDLVTQAGTLSTAYKIEELKPMLVDYSSWRALAAAQNIRGTVSSRKDLFLLKDALSAAMDHSRLDDDEGELERSIHCLVVLSLLGVPLMGPTILSGAGDQRNYCRQSIQPFLSTIGLTIDAKTKEPLGRRFAKFVTQFEGAALNLANVFPDAALGICLMSRALSSSRMSNTNLDSLPACNLIRVCLSTMQSDLPRTFEISLLAQISALPEWNLRSLVAASANKLLDQPKGLLALIEMCIAHAPKNPSLAGIAMDIAILSWHKMSLHSQIRYIQLTVLPLGLILPDSEWRTLIKRMLGGNPNRKIAMVLIRQLTAMAVLARQAPQIDAANKDEEDTNLARREAGVAHLVPISWHRILWRMSAVSDGSQSRFQSEMTRYTSSAKETLAKQFSALMEDFSHLSFVEDDVELIAIWSKFLIQLALLFPEEVSAIRKPALAHGWLYLHGLENDKAFIEDLFALQSETTDSVFPVRALAHAHICLRQGREQALKSLNELLQLAAMKNLINQERLRRYVSVLALMTVNPTMFAVISDSVRTEKISKSSPECSEAEDLQLYGWSSLFESEIGANLLVDEEYSTDEGFMTKYETTTTSLCRCSVVEGSPLVTIDRFLRTARGKNFSEPLDRVIISAADGEECEREELKALKRLRLESIERRLEPETLPPVTIRSGQFLRWPTRVTEEELSQLALKSLEKVRDSNPSTLR